MTTEPEPAGDRRVPVAVLGATGSVGQRMVSLLENHPWYRLGALTASERSAGRPYGEVVAWSLATPVPRAAAEMTVRRTDEALDELLLFSALDASVAGDAESRFAAEGHLVVSNARNHRMDPHVPLLVPEANPEHLALMASQSFGGGAIVTNPNCSTIGLTLALHPLHRAFGVERVHVVTLQAVSGGGLTGVSGLRAIDNVVPFIGGEEQKMETETCKILGALQDGAVAPAPMVVSAQCNRVPVVDGHTLCVSMSLRESPDETELRAAWEGFTGVPQRLGLPSAPEQPIVLVDTEDGPQPRLHRDVGGGMAITVGRIQPCPSLDYKFVTVSHNTVRGAAGGAILCAELVTAEGLFAGLTAPQA